MSKDKIGSDNIVVGKRRKGKKQLELPTFTPPPEPPAEMETNIDRIFEMEEEKMASEENRGSKKARRFKVLDRVKIKTTRFGKKFAKGLPIWTYGTIMKIKGKVCDVQWDDSEGVDLRKSHTYFLEMGKKETL
jgi:hypothetical protein